MDGYILSGVDQSASYWVGSAVLSLTSSGLVLVNYVRHLFVIPVRESDNKFFVVLEGRIRIANDKGSPKTIRILAHVVRMPPVGACLVGLNTSRQ